MNGGRAAGFRLFRSESDRKISGVAGGLAEALELDSTLVRLLWVLVVLVTSGVGLLAYLALWAIAPSRSQAFSGPADPAPAEPAPENAAGPGQTPGPEPEPPAAPPAVAGRSNGPVIAGVVLIVVGALFLADNWISLEVWSYFWTLIELALRLWPLILIAAGVVLLYSRLRR